MQPENYLLGKTPLLKPTVSQMQPNQQNALSIGKREQIICYPFVLFKMDRIERDLSVSLLKM